MNRTLLTMITVALALVIVLPLSLFATSDNYNYCAANQGQYAEAPKDDESTPSVHGSISDPTFVRLLVHCSGVYATQNADAITAIATVVMTVATFLLGWLALDQGRTARAQLRGYVFARIDTQHIKRGDIPEMALAVKNFGPTPVRKMALAGKIKALLPKEYGHMKIPTDEPPEIMLPPGESYYASIFGDGITTDAEWDEIVAKKKVLHFAGVIVYEDAFGRERETRFCWVWRGPINAKGEHQISTAPKGNSWT
jgi:hypothetical protein